MTHLLHTLLALAMGSLDLAQPTPGVDPGDSPSQVEVESNDPPSGADALPPIPGTLSSAEAEPRFEADPVPEPEDPPTPVDASGPASTPGETEDRSDDEGAFNPDTDPLGPVEQVLDELAGGGFRVSEKQRSQGALRGDFLTAEIRGGDPDLLLYKLQSTARDGYQILLESKGRDHFGFVALRARVGQGRGVDFVAVDNVTIIGRFRQGEDASILQKYAGLPLGGVVSMEVAERLATIGYRATFRALDEGELEITVEPGRAIRRVRLRRRIPLPERELVRVLSPRSRPGMLAMAPCLPPKKLRRSTSASICPADDPACRQWEKEEIARIERYLSDQGFFEGTAHLGVACGKRPDQADLWVILDKGRSFRMGKITVTGNVGSADHRWIRRMFRPTVGPFLPIPKRITRAQIEDAKDRVEREYAEPRGGPRTTARSSLKLPYPGVRVDTNYERITPATLPRGTRRIPITVDIQLGSGVQTVFENNDRVAESRLRPQLQLFQRREPATPTTAAREAENLRSFYQTKGHVLADVDGSHGTRGLLTRLRFDIREGPKVRIRDIAFAPTPSVLPAVQTSIQQSFRKARKLAPGGAFSDNQARTDLGIVLREYAQRGFLCATVRLRIAFWPQGLDQPGAHAVLDLSTGIEAAGDPSWIERQFSPEGLEALRGRSRAGLYVRFEVEPGPRVFTSGREEARHLEIPIPPSREVENLPVTSVAHWDVSRMLEGGPLRRDDDARIGGLPLHLSLERQAERAIERAYREHGFPLADAEIRWIYTDDSGQTHRVPQTERLTDPEVGLCAAGSDHEAVTVDTEVSVYEGRKAAFGTTLIRGNFKTQSWLLHREVAWEDGELYNRQLTDATRRRIEGTGTVEAVQIREQPTDCDLTDDPDKPCVVHEVISVTEAKDRSMDLQWGFGFATLDPFYVFLRPSFPNMLGSGWDLRLDTHFGTNVRLPRFCTEQEDCYERTGRLSLSRRRIFASALTFEISGQVQRRATPARGIIDSALGEVRLSLPIRDEWRFYWSYFIQGANISKDVVKPSIGPNIGCPPGVCRPPNRSEAIVPDLTGALQTGIHWQRVDNPFNPEKGFMADVDMLIASPYLGGQDWWTRVQGAWQHFIPLPGREQRFSFRYAIRYGHAVPLRRWPGAETTSVPEVWRFFGGGTADLGLRGIEPQTMLLDLETIPTGFGASIVRPNAQGGHIRALATFALQVVTVRNFLGGRLAHSVFLDLGVLTQRWRDVVPLRDIRRSVGINFVKWDIKIVTVSLGYAILVPNAIIPGNVRPTDDRNGRVVFDVGATF